MLEFEKMTGPELVATFNAMARANGLNPVKKFKDRATGIKRCEAVASLASNDAKGKPGVKPQANGTVDAFDCKNNNRLRMIRLLASCQGKQVPAENFGRLPDWDSAVKIESAVEGLKWRIKVSNLPYELKVEKKDGKVVSVGLHAKE